MWEYFKTKIHIILIILIVILGIVTLILYFSPEKTTVNVESEIPAEGIVADEALSYEEKNVLLIALDYIYTYGNYSATENSLESLQGRVTSNFQPQLDALIAELNNSQSQTFSTIKPAQSDYVLNIVTGRATVQIPANQTNNEIQNKNVKVTLVLKLQNNEWYLDEFNVE